MKNEHNTNKPKTKAQLHQARAQFEILLMDGTTAKDAAQLLGVSITTATKWAKGANVKTWHEAEKAILNRLATIAANANASEKDIYNLTNSLKVISGIIAGKIAKAKTLKGVLTTARGKKLERERVRACPKLKGNQNARKKLPKNPTQHTLEA